MLQYCCMNTYKCTRCYKFLKEDKFGLSRNKLHRSKSCIECLSKVRYKYGLSEERKKKHSEYYFLNKEDIKIKKADQRLKRKYNLTTLEVKQMIEKQNGKCAICEKDFNNDFLLESSKNACVDHDHQTGKVRGMLCRKCNIALPIVEDRSYCEKALIYLRANEV